MIWWAIIVTIIGTMDIGIDIDVNIDLNTALDAVRRQGDNQHRDRTVPMNQSASKIL
jgi:hypothetical protein